MPWRDRLDKLKGEFNAIIGEQRPPPQQQQQQQYFAHPPQQQPPHNGWQQQQQHPNAGGSMAPPIPPRPARIAWQPRFQPDIPVTEEWDAKIGNGPDGWGNQELQYYTADKNNAFQ
jgi:hypothetical protein